MIDDADKMLLRKYILELNDDQDYLQYIVATLDDYIVYFENLKSRFSEYTNLRIDEGILWGDILETDDEYTQRKKDEMRGEARLKEYNAKTQKKELKELARLKAKYEK